LRILKSNAHGKMTWHAAVSCHELFKIVKLEET
jgi:hypothetical protein